jgi:hypothetical protein
MLPRYAIGSRELLFRNIKEAAMGKNDGQE